MVRKIVISSTPSQGRTADVSGHMSSVNGKMVKRVANVKLLVSRSAMGAGRARRDKGAWVP